MVDLWEILLLAVVQGVAEFLPVSSSGHLVVLGHWLELKEISDINIVLHVGTLLSILVFYWRRVQALLLKDRRLLGLLALGTAPAVGFGLLIKLQAPQWLESPLLTGILLILTGLILIAVYRFPPRQRDSEELRWGEAMLIGVAQAAAVLPGLSRSGMTIATGLHRGLKPVTAASFSFLLAIPIIAGGGVYELVKHQGFESSATPPSFLILGASIAFLVGWASLCFLSYVMDQRRLDRFAWWCIPLGGAVIVWQITSGA